MEAGEFVRERLEIHQQRTVHISIGSLLIMESVPLIKCFPRGTFACRGRQVPWPKQALITHATNDRTEYFVVGHGAPTKNDSYLNTMLPFLLLCTVLGADPARYTKLLKAAYGAIKAADPTALVITAGLAPACTCNSNMKPQDFLLGIYAAGGKGYFDAVGMHPYTFPALPTATDGSAYWWTSMGKDLRAIMAANGDLSKTIWPTEYGAPTGGPAGSGKVSERTQAAMLTAAYNLNQDAAWAGPLFWYCLNDPGTDTSTAENFFGLLRYNKTKKPAYAALKAVQGR